MIRTINLFRYVRRYQWILGIGMLLIALFVLAKPPVPADLNYKYQLDIRLRSYPLVAPTAGLVEWSTERIREVYRWNLTAETMGKSMPPSRAGGENAVAIATFFIALGALAMVLIWFVPAARMVGVGMVIFVIAGSHVAAHPAAYSELAATPSTLIPNITATLVTHADPGHSSGFEREADIGLKDMADRYFEQYVRYTEHRMGDAGKVLAGPKRLWFGISGFIYVLPFALILAALAALTTLLQTLCWALAVVAPFGLVIAMGDGRAGLKVWDHVIMPLLACMALLAILGLALPMVLFVATLVNATENEIGRLAIGSMFPILLVAAGAIMFRRLRGGRYATGSASALGSEGRATIPGHHPDRTGVLGSTSRVLRALDPRARRPRQRHLGNLRDRDR